MQQNWKFRRGDIYYVQFGNTSTGSEQHGDRPAVIIQNDVGNTYAPTLIVVPLTSNTEKKVTQPTHCLLENEGLSMSSMALAEQIFTIDKSRILKYLGHLPGRYAAARLCLEEQSCLEPTGQHSEAQAHHPLHGSVCAAGSSGWKATHLSLHTHQIVL